MNRARLIALFTLTLLASLSFGSALAGECAAAPMRGDNGAYNGCEVVHGTNYETHAPEEISEEACPHLCDALNEIDEMAAESRDLDAKAGF
ncbi:MAG: hypothetical protein JST04_10720 [Bdellovibrionales bacterium]|nr:hypothetical protein [Bdellovibrionales bacterium]